MKKQRQIELLEAEVAKWQQAAEIQNGLHAEKISQLQDMRERDESRRQTLIATNKQHDKWQKRAISAQHQVATLTTSLQRMESDLGKLRDAIGGERWREIVGRGAVKPEVYRLDMDKVTINYDVSGRTDVSLQTLGGDIYEGEIIIPAAKGVKWHS